ncbi:MAG: YbdK family carboxylate-amine ligase [Candidatus Eremiobacterota bacterium]
MDTLSFATSRFLTLGVEVEIQLVDYKTLDLCPAAPRILGGLVNDPSFQPELYKTMLEVSTGVCNDLEDVEADLTGARERLLPVTDDDGVEILGTGTHPFADRGREDDLSDSPRYHRMLLKDQWVARNKNTFGLHVHVGATGGDHAIALMNAASAFLPHLLALSASSPFRYGQDTGLASSRGIAFESQPTSGLAPRLEDWSDFRHLVTGLRQSGSIESLKDLHWDIRPSPRLGTVEVRICDGQACLADTLALVAAVQCLFAWLDRTLDGRRAPPAWRQRENKWRAIRWGLDGDVVVDDQGTVRPLRDEWLALLRAFRPVAAPLGCARHLKRVEWMVREGGNSSIRQRALLKRCGSLYALVQALVHEWRTPPKRRRAAGTHGLRGTRG